MRIVVSPFKDCPTQGLLLAQPKSILLDNRCSVKFPFELWSTTTLGSKELKHQDHRALYYEVGSQSEEVPWIYNLPCTKGDVAGFVTG